MYKYRKGTKTLINLENTIEGETIEKKCERMVHNKEQIKDGAPLIFTERKDGVIQAYNIRTDRWEVATEAMDLVQKSKDAKRDDKPKNEDEKGKVIEMKNDGGAESTHGKADPKENQSK